jgi:transcriptional regulator with XRE-family HTH domain
VGGRRIQERIEPAIWHRSDMRTALAARDIAVVFRLLQRVGVSQRRIAALTGQSQSEISEILGGRQVVSYEVLARIADGLGVPRGHLGLAYDDATAQLVGTGQPTEDDGPVLGRLAELAVGTATIDAQVWSQPFALAWARPPGRIGRSDVARLEKITAELRAVDYAQGGGACRDAALAQVAWAQQLLRAPGTEGVERALHGAVGDLHLLAGWTSFDIGLVGPARRHFTRALEHARYVDEPSLVAKALYCLARVHIHHDWGAQAVRLLQLAQVAAQQSGYGRAAALVHANLGWAQSLVGDVRQALGETSRARDEYGRSEDEPVPAWLRHFDSAEVQALRGATLTYLPDQTPAQRAEAIERLFLSTALRELPMVRSRAFELTMLSWMLVENGDADEATRIGHQAVDLAEQVRSQRVIDRFAPLRAALQRRPEHDDLRELDARIGRVPSSTDGGVPVRRTAGDGVAAADRIRACLPND